MPTLPNVNYELYIDGQEITYFNGVDVRQTLSAISSFSIDLNNPDGIKTSRFPINIGMEFKASFGNRSPATIITGLVKAHQLTTGKQRKLILSGSDLADYIRRKRPWEDEAMTVPISFSGTPASQALTYLLGKIPQIKIQITKLTNEPEIDYICKPESTNMFQEFKRIAEYAGYDFFMQGDTMIVRPPKELTEAATSYNLIFGDINNYPTLPELPYAWLLSSNLGIDGNTIKNVYKVDGATGISAVARSFPSIQAYNGEFEGYYKDERLTSQQSCYVVAKRLADINGYPQERLSCAHRGVNLFEPSDVVFVGDAKNGFNELSNQYMRVVDMSHQFGKSWRTTTNLGFLERNISDALKAFGIQSSL